jgi:iron complex outermembrane receptor protein
MRQVWLGSIALLATAPVSAADEQAPVAATARFTGDELVVRGDPWQLLPDARTPALLGIRAPGTGALARSLRGLSDSATPAPLDPAVGLFVDGVPLGRLDGEAFALFDLESSTLHMGGQGAALGRNSSAGALELRLAAPAAEFGGFVGGAWGAWDRKMVQGSVDVPLGALALKVSAYVSDDDGTARNRITGEKLNDEDRAGVRLAAALRPTDRLAWTIAAAYTQDKGENILAFTCNPLDPSACGGRSATTGMVKARVLGGGPQYGLPVTGDKADQVLGRVQASTLVTSRLAWATDQLEIALISGFLDSTDRSGLDFADGRGLPTATLPDPPVRGFVNGGYARLTDASARQMSQELRLSGKLLGGALDWSAGGQLIDGDDRLDAADLQTLEDGTPTGTPRLLSDRVIRTSHRALSAHANAAFASGPFRLEAGLRYSDEEKRLTSLAQAACGPAGCLSPASAPQKLTTGVWTPRAAAGFDLGKGVSLFASAARGYRPGGWNLAAVTPAAFGAYAPETSWTFEGGLSARAFDGALTARLAGFYLTATDMQGSGAAVIGGVPQFWAGTLADFRNRGAELDLELRPLEALSLTANLAFQDAGYRRTSAVDVQIAQCLSGVAAACGIGAVTASGALAEPAFAPDVSLGVGGRYDWPLPSAGIILSPQLDLLWRSSFRTDPANLVEGAGAHLLVDAAVAIRTDDSAWLLTLSCRNCLDEDQAQASLFGWSYPQTPRSWMVAARRRF